MDPVFIIGTERSGTNLLRLILNTHSNIAIPHPPHIMKNFSALEKSYGDLSEDKRFEKLVGDVITSVGLHQYEWDVMLDRRSVIDSVKDRNLINIFFQIYEQYLSKTAKKRWGCKSTFMIDHVNTVLQYYSKAKFIYMVRDGRDVALSAKRSVFNRYDPYYTARLWSREQKTGIKLLQEIDEDTIMLLKYEELIQHPEHIVNDVCAFLKEQFEDNMLHFFRTPEARRSASLNISWKNTDKPFIRHNKGKYLRGLKRTEILLFESIAHEQLSYFSYELTIPADETKNRFRLKYILNEIIHFLLVQIKTGFSGKNNMLRYKKYLFIKYVYLRNIIRGVFERKKT